MIDLGQLIGQPFQSHFQVIDSKTGQIEMLKDVRELNKQFLEEADFTNGDDAEEVKESDQIKVGHGTDNRDFVDNNKAQKLTHDEIEDLKKQGLTGQELINKLIENSETFSKRTKFSQEKYLRKKKQKYEVRFQAKRPSALELCATYCQNQPAKIMALRPDSLGFMLNYANINYESRVLLCDKTKGLITGALVEKDVREIMNVDFAQVQLKMQQEILGEYNFDQTELRKIQYVHHSLITNEAMHPDILIGSFNKSKSKHFNSCIIAHEELHPLEIFQHIEHLIQPSASIAVFSQFVQVLAELKDYLIAQKRAVNIKIEELWTREHQVLPMRTHPQMNMHGASGFILSAVKIQ